MRLSAGQSIPIANSKNASKSGSGRVLSLRLSNTTDMEFWREMSLGISTLPSDILGGFVVVSGAHIHMVVDSYLMI